MRIHHVYFSMKTQSTISLLLLILITGCKSGTESQPNYNYVPLSVGSHWTYFDGTRNYTRTAVGDTVINGNTYTIVVQNPTSKVLARPLDSVWYFRKVGNDVHILQPDTMNVLTEFPYINAGQGASGSYYIISTPNSNEHLVTYVTYYNTSQNFTDTVNGKIYPNVFREHIRSEILHPGTTSVVTEGDYYFADGVGLIDQIVSGDLTMILTDYVIK
jgi:hypothetical protein